MPETTAQKTESSTIFTPMVERTPEQIRDDYQHWYAERHQQELDKVTEIKKNLLPDKEILDIGKYLQVCYGDNNGKLLYQDQKVVEEVEIDYYLHHPKVKNLNDFLKLREDF